MPSSAQWMSSKANTSGPWLAHASMPERSAEKNALAQALGVLALGHQLGGHLEPDQPAEQGGLADALLAQLVLVVAALEQPAACGSSSLPQAASAESLSTIPQPARITSPSAQKTMPLP